MCGVAGFVRSGLSLEEREHAARRMGAALQHRGPDGEGVQHLLDHGLTLVHRRLAVLDLTRGGAQPMADRSGVRWLSYNGEIYNHAELRTMLQGEGIEFRGRSDTEVLLEGLARWGVAETLAKAVGMFAFAYWDGETRELWLVRDRFGEKPLYYLLERGALTFASQLSGLKAAPGISAAIDHTALHAFLRYGVVPAPHSILRNVRALPPGTALQFVVDAEQARLVRQHRYWPLEEGRVTPSSAMTIDEGVARLELHLREAVRSQGMADVPLGAFLSGGVDSSLVVALLRQETSGALHTFSIGFEAARYDESPYASAVADALDTEHHAVQLSDQDALRIVERIGKVYDEPFADSSQIATIAVAELARRWVTVSLSGDGADELFGGYGRYQYTDALWRRLSLLPLGARRPLAALLHGAAWVIGRVSRAVPRCLLQRDYQQRSLAQRLDGGARKIRSSSPRQLYEQLLALVDLPPEYAPGVVDRSELSFSAESPDADSVWRWMLEADLHHYLPNDILVKVDRAAMSVALESRMPFLDHRLVAMARSLPRSLRTDKVLPKTLLQRFLPESLVHRPKRGFAVPLDAWLRGALRSWASELLDESLLTRDGIFDGRAVRRLWRAHLEGCGAHGQQLWGILMFQAWRAAHPEISGV